MASILFFLFLSLSFFRASAQQIRQTNINIGSYLTPTKNSSWLSPSGLYAFGFYKERNGYSIGVFLAGIRQQTVVWTAKRDDPPVSSDVILLFTSSNGLSLQSAQGQNNNTVLIYTPQTASSASLSDSGNFVLYNSDKKIIWESFDDPTDTLLPTQRLGVGQRLFSAVSKTDHSAGKFLLIMQGDGNLVQYAAGYQTPADAYYATATTGSGNNVSLNFDRDGRLYLVNSTGFNLLNLTGGGYPIKDMLYLMRIDIDGIFRLYSYNQAQSNGNWTVLWASSYDKCDPKGLCGFNSYCVLNDQEPDCLCPQGFKFVAEGNRSSGCERILIAESCQADDDNGNVIIREIPNSKWDDDPYAILSLSMKQDCEKACLEDCHCDAAFFNKGQCRKQKLPLRYGRRDGSESSSALIKVISISTPNNRIDESTEKRRDKLGKILLIASGSIAGLGFLMLAISSIAIYKYHEWAHKRISNNDQIALSEEVGPRSFSYEELENVTDNFKEEIGRGSFGVVYKGIISNSKKLVAVKKLEGVVSQGEREFQTEVKTIGKTYHKNLVRLLGYCNEGSNRLLVYEYMSNKSLSDVLFSSSPENRPCFEERAVIASNVARGILDLHEECEVQIIHCDIKPQNILMDENRCPKISDFGLAKLLKSDETKTFTGIRGTRGYVAPEWHKKLPVTVKADVYSFGIVLLEIACCRKNVDHNLPEAQCILVDWVYHCFEAGEMDKLVGVDKEIDMKQMDRMIKVRLWCTLDEPSLRPSMKKVLLMLEGTVDIPIPPSPTSFLSSILVR